MEKGHLRCDANISVRPRGEKKLGTRTEMKNLNSFRGVERGLTYEIGRQIALLEEGGSIVQSTLQWDDSAGKTRVLRIKEEADDYRYFPEPDLVPLIISSQQTDATRSELPELPAAIEDRFAREYGLKVRDIEVLTSSRELANYYEAVLAAGSSPESAAQWVQGEVLRVLNEERQEIGDFAMPAEQLAGLINLVDAGAINRTTGKAVFDAMLESGLSAGQIVERDDLGQVSDMSALEEVIQSVLAAHPVELQRYHKGEWKLLGFFMGQAMSATRGQGNPQVVREILAKALDG